MSKAAVSRPRVYVRIRPLNEREKREGNGELICHGDQRMRDTLFVRKDESGAELQTRFDCVFDRDATQANIFDTIGPEVLNTLFSGYNASIFAYGQTGSGKTYTMEGDHSKPERLGVTPRLVRAIFERFKGNPDISRPVCEVSLVQIYQEKIQDLLAGQKQLEIHMDRTGQYIARDATWTRVRSLEESMKLYKKASEMRTTSSTDMNLVSSRSHMIMMMKLQWDEPSLPGSHAQLNLVDLAGSERIALSGATGDLMKEAIHINKSLSALGNVVSKLVEQAKHKGRRVHIPYKDSKLTYLLQSSIGGSNLIHFILAVSCSALWRSETNSTIEFGKRALQLVLRPVRNAIDYTRLAEMEEMIERMRSHIASLEEALRDKSSEAAEFLKLKQIPQDGDEGPGKFSDSRGRRQRKKLKMQTELARIMANLPETFDDLTSHCVLFPESKGSFRELGGLQHLVHFVDRSASTFYRSNAAQTIASVLDDKGRDMFVEIDGVEALTRLLHIKEERCKEAACVALEAVCRGSLKNKQSLSPAVYTELVDLIYSYPNQQVQEAACTAVATIVDLYPEARRTFERLDIVPKLLETIRNTPEEVVNLIKSATNCIGRLSHGDPEMQDVIASFGGIDLLIDVLFSNAGTRDHQVPILASYALVNLCCSNEQNLDIAQDHPRYGEVKFRLLEGLARAFGVNTAREGFGRATAHETGSPFPYYGVTIVDKWSFTSSGGRPIFSTFMDNPQFYLYVSRPTDVAFMIQDVLYETRMLKKKKNNTVYMGLALFEGDPELAKAGLKQVDFHGRMVEIGKYTSNCENVLHCTLQPSEVPYVVVPFTSQRGRQTEFALSAFADSSIELTAVPEQVGWVRTVLDGCWTEFTGRGGDGFDWRCNPQISIQPKENCRCVFVLSYLSLDQQRAYSRDEEAEEQNTRPRLYGRLFTNSNGEKRYLKALVPLPQKSTFVASNSFASNSYITTSANLTAGESYTYIPFTETPYEDTWRLSVYCDTDDVAIAPINGSKSEWYCTTSSGEWAGKPLSIQLDTKGRMVAVASSPGSFLRVRLFNAKGKKLEGIDAYWNAEASVEYKSQGAVTVQVEGMVRTENGQEPARGLKVDVFIFTENKCTVQHVDFPASPSSLLHPTKTTPIELLRYPVEVVENDAPFATLDQTDDDEEDATCDEDDSYESKELELKETLERRNTENAKLLDRIAEQQRELQELRMLQNMLPSSATHNESPGSGSPNDTRINSGMNQVNSKKDNISRKGDRNGAAASSNGSPVSSKAISPSHFPQSGGGGVSRSMREAIERSLVTLNRLECHTEPPKAGEWGAIRNEVKELRKLLGLALSQESLVRT
ncbi:kinesin, putative [Trypanosoma equiperdum]|uniref:Kinesin, putative n=4 Tax=Trypanozoon TaxID=39700 RepID=Q582C4_TRYB2|nr:kinesin, putative [Trypanosoma brucei gambiense DAL972]XP_844915.1 kinesin, putative [Trypanosoma brucei brucei TREU927]AAX80445.1 kinesin, putative [Trypanosoma brucei]RHW72388.1 kinesin [Trypanosoma brucei equiperdum]SCU70324.1 kinesin, putative [Trypanosoma equiperdum]AAZ11356.1 kinesin, putative [Trypanosoma brucei brucei TREU927]CBH11204.1 kinesin, putative [Trypanosoma brucei gambiense DAL972]|eukprot:XP_011773491.1 kinesin, putative [Trypanosoma brucei gambiense DAL972]